MKQRSARACDYRIARWRWLYKDLSTLRAWLYEHALVVHGSYATSGWRTSVITVLHVGESYERMEKNRMVAFSLWLFGRWLMTVIVLLNLNDCFR